ncbi:uncharacterized protein LOC131035151 [Cryptomeria japonica]|uniref:uncharacterized protein LOC131035151 n=1 Tax=Cryptomeria japonica TaxID=3369 RepID=UPI0027DA0BC8|nr:uncharacterized protein LOC131035151 [Cryptomeria japonica]
MLVDKEKDSFYCFPFYPWGHNKQGVTADYAIEASQRKRGEDAPHQNVALNAVPTTTTGAGILLKNDGEKTTTVNEVGLDEDHTVAGNVNLDSQLNLSDKDDDTVEEFTEKPPSRAASHPNITIQSITSHTSTTATSRVNNVKIKETSYTATGTTKTTSCLDGDSEFLQQEEQYPRLPNIEVTEGRLGIPTSSSIPALNDGQNVQAEAKFEVPKENVTEKTSDRHVQHASDTAGNNVLPRSGSDEKDYLCSCIPVSLPTIWSWSSKELIADEQLKKPLLADLKDKLTIDEEVLVTLRDDQQRKVIFPSKVDSVESSSSLETQDPATLVQKKVDDSVRLNKVDDSVSQSSEISPDSSNIASPTDGRAAVVINIRQSANTEAADPGVVTDWDLLKSIVYGGLTVSITSLGVVSSAAGGDAKTLTVIAISLANLVAGFFLIIKDILYLHHFDKIKFEDSVGHSFLFNGFIAIVSYLVFGSLAPITYGFSFQNSDDTLYKFLAASLVSLISIILLALGKARVANKSYNIVAQEAYKTYIRVVILYVVTGFWASFIGFFAGKYIKKLLEKWGFTTD